MPRDSTSPSAQLTSRPGALRDRIRGASPMAESIRLHPWEQTELGAVAGWPSELVMAVNMILATKVVAVIYWGAARLMLYNDAYTPHLAHRHPALGERLAEVWPEVHAEVEEILRVPWETGVSSLVENVSLRVQRQGRNIEKIYTLMTDPIWIGGPGGAEEPRIAGLYHTAIDNTEGVEATRRLQASERRASQVLRSIGDAVIVTDAEATITRMNPVAEALTGWTEKESCGLPLDRVFQIVEEATRRPVESPVERVKRIDATVALAAHTVLVARNGAETSIDHSASPVPDETGGLAGLVLVFRDISERRMAERERDALTDRLNQVLQATSDAVMTIDRQWRVTYMNPRAMKVALPVTEIVGRVIWEALPNFIPAGAPWVENYHRAMEERIACSFEAFYEEPFEAWLLVEVQPSTEGITLFFSDVTEQKRTEAELRRSQEHAVRSEAELKLITDALPVFVSYVDRELRYLRVNRTYEEWFAQPASEILGRTINEVLGEQSAEAIQGYLQAALAGTPQHFEYRPVLMGEERVLSVAHIPDFDHNRQVRGVVIQGHDITEQKRTEEALIQSEKLAAAGRLAASIAHEINNPLESVTNLLYLARNAEDTGTIHFYLDTAERELRRVSVISNQTLRFYKQSTNPRPVAAEDLIESVLSIYQGRTVNARIQVETRMRAKGLTECFEGEIRQVLSNLVGNAIDAMPEGGLLLLRSRTGTNWKSDEAGLIITVADTGSGMSQVVRKKLFDAFYTTKGIGGTGLGLWVSREIVTRHQGALHLRSSQGMGTHGTVFRLFLPAHAVKR